MAFTATAHAAQRIPLAIGSDGHSLTASSGQGQRLAVVVSRRTTTKLAVFGAHDRWRQVTLATRRPHAVRFARLEGGAGLVAWDAGDAVRVRTWDRTGKLGPQRTVLTGVNTVWEGDTQHPGWDLASNRSGTVAIAAPTLQGGVRVTVREPGEDFAAAQDLRASGDLQPAISITAIATDGTMVVTWRDQAPYQDVAPGDATGAAMRQQRGAFAAIDPPAAHEDPSVWVVEGSRAVHPADDVLALCQAAKQGCRDPQLFTWPGGRQVLVFRRNFDQSYTAVRGTDGSFGKPRFASVSRVPVWTSKPGRVNFIQARKGALYVTTR
ncbi:hypothetical protein OM076_02910 [Solirubrobacter ginsenosidimutans]|uniref:Uncharacterized protein n=1 Tax=Solirubrobacter ginsenosidimutans TaxID=490573 RepID=A0A9X3MT64_9ACTN|nr:hypothetical protein [Solirubrobacter ginsenosidimutans]MDA0159203.1 hypothetical protein [Solirubrobacter ginsenosidimutans]